MGRSTRTTLSATRDAGGYPELMWFVELVQDFWFFLKERKAWWLTPIVVVLLLLTILIVVSEKAAVLPFIYTLF